MPERAGAGPAIAITASRSDGPWRADTLCRQAESAEAMGFHSFWLPENHFGDPRAIPSPLTLLAAVAGRTGRLKLGTTSYLLPIRDPVLAAEEVAVLDQLSEGRLILGVGRGIQGPVFDVFGIPIAEKRARFRENLEVMLAAWRGEPLPGGDEATTLAPLPYQRPHPPLWVAAFGKLALKQVGALGLPYLASPIEPLPVLEANLRRHREAFTEAGHTALNELPVPVMRTVFISEHGPTVNRVRESLAKYAPRQLLPEGTGVEDWAVVGDAAYARDRLAQYVETLSITHLIGGGRLPDVGEDAQLASHQALARIGPELRG